MSNSTKMTAKEAKVVVNQFITASQESPQEIAKALVSEYSDDSKVNSLDDLFEAISREAKKRNLIRARGWEATSEEIRMWVTIPVARGRTVNDLISSMAKHGPAGGLVLWLMG